MAAATACRITASLMRTAEARAISRSAPMPSVAAIRYTSVQPLRLRARFALVTVRSPICIVFSPVKDSGKRAEMLFGCTAA